MCSFQCVVAGVGECSKNESVKRSVLEKESRHRNLKNKNEIAKDREDLISGVVKVCGKTVLTVCTAELGRTD